jgi:predicted amidophosphoribosyltransferase
MICPQCRAALDAADNYCRRCGAPTANRADSSLPQYKWWESPWVVLALLFLVLGPFALPLLWRSRRFTRLWKYVLTILVAGITAFIVWQIWYLFHQMLAPLRDLQQLQGF